MSQRTSTSARPQADAVQFEQAVAVPELPTGVVARGPGGIHRRVVHDVRQLGDGRVRVSWRADATDKHPHTTYYPWEYLLVR